MQKRLLKSSSVLSTVDSKSIGSSGLRLKHAMGDQARLVVVPRDGDDRGTVVLDARVDADPDRHQAIGEHRLGSRIDAASQEARSIKLDSLPTNLFSTSLR